MRRLAVLLLTIALLAIGTRAGASFSTEELATLAAGDLLIERSTYDRGSEHYVGGVSYLVVDLPAARLSAVARDVSAIPALLPHVSDVQLLEVTAGGVGRIRITHTLGPTSGSYTLRIAFFEAGTFGRFSIEPSEGSAVLDGWGYVRLTPIGAGERTLVTYAVLFDLGPGVLRSLFESRIQDAALSYPRRLAHAASY